MAKHTATPWRVDGRSIFGPGRDDEIVDYVYDLADAEFIVHAVNAHDDLLAACESALHALRNLKLEDRIEYPAVEMRLRAAIAKARGTNEEPTR